MTGSAQSTAVVFAYHQMGVRCLAALLAVGVDVRLVVTHRDDSSENVWWDSVAELAHRAGIEVITPEDPNTPLVIERLGACAPDFIFSFYYRHMLHEPLLRIPPGGAFNLHGSLLPKYRGRVPVNWALVHGENGSGVTLHRMVLKPDAGNLLAQEAVSILPNDTARDLFLKLVCAAERVLLRALPELMEGTLEEHPMDLSRGTYFGGRRPEDGRIDWTRSAWEIHNLIRAVAPPYPGAFTDIGGTRLFLLGSYWRDEGGTGDNVGLYWESGRCYADCADGNRFELTLMASGGEALDEQGFRKLFGNESIVRPDLGDEEA